MSSKRKKFFTGLLLLLLLPILLVWLALQPFFIKAVILPQVEKATDSEIEVGEISFSVLKSVSLSDVRFSLNDDSVDARMASVILRYDLIKILNGTIWVDECSLISPDITYRAPSTPPVAAAESTYPETASSQPTPQLHIQKVTITDGTFALHQDGKVLKLEDLNFELPELINGSPIAPSLRTKILGFAEDDSSRVFMEGQLNSHATLEVSNSLMPTSFNGSVEATLGRNEAGIPPLSFKLNTHFDMNLEKKVFSLQSLFAEALQGNKSLLTLQLNQPAQISLQEQPPQFTDTEITLVIPLLQIETLPFAEFIPVSSGGISLNSRINISDSGKKIGGQVDFVFEKIVLPLAEQPEDLRLGSAKGNGTFSWTPDADAVANVYLSASDLIVPDGKILPSPLEIQVKGKGSPTRATFENLEFSWAETPGFQNRVKATGFADWQNPKAMDVEIKVVSDNLDLNPWSAFLVQQPKPPSADPIPKEDAEPKPSKIELPHLPLKNLVVDLSMGQIRFQELRFDQLRMNLHADSGNLQLQPFSLEINGSTFSSHVDAQWGNSPLRIRSKSSLSPLDLQPLIDTFYPEKKGAVTGILQANTDFYTEGDSPQSLWENFKGQVDLSYTEGKIRLLNSDPEQNTALLHTRQLVLDIVGALADALQLSSEQLTSPEIESVLFKAQIQDQHLSLKNAQIINPEFLLEASGEVDLLPDIGRSTFESLPVTLGLSTNVAKRVKVYREQRVRGEHVMLPSFIAVSGTLAEPKIEVKKSVITGLIISGVTERNDVGNQDVQKGLEFLGSILTGEPIPVKTPVPLPTPLPGVPPTATPKPDTTDKILQGIKLFQQIRATPIPPSEDVKR